MKINYDILVCGGGAYFTLILSFVLGGFLIKGFNLYFFIALITNLIAFVISIVCLVMQLKKKDN